MKVFLRMVLFFGCILVIFKILPCNYLQNYKFTQLPGFYKVNYVLYLSAFYPFLHRFVMGFTGDMFFLLINEFC